ncbi:MAG: YciK family oxidoreductase [Gammaproteobacteria bacterium]|nr:YciK family oxidoreductase [Gammaproteobacteria bacterium]
MKNYSPAKDILKNRVILVTGAGSGIGKAAALKFAEYGATVVLLDKAEAKIESVYDQIESSGQARPALFPMDLATATPDAYTGLAAALSQEFGKLDGLLNNAGILGSITPLNLYDDQLWDKVMNVNLHAPYRLTRACLGLMAQSPDASIVFTTADVARHGRAYWGAYAVAAAGVEAMTQVWAEELDGDNRVRVNAINPGAVYTDMRAKAYPGENPKTLVKPADIMPAYLYLMSADSRAVSGRVINAQDDF